MMAGGFHLNSAPKLSNDWGPLLKKVTTTVSYYISPQWTVSTPKRFNTQYSGFEINTTNERNGTYSFVKVQGEHTFPVDETLIYQWSESKSGWTGLFVFLAVTVGVALLGGVGGLLAIGGFSLTSVLAGAGFGAIGGLVATGFSPTTNTTAEITPFSYSAYQLDPSQNMSGDAKEVATRTFQNWISPEVMNTPGGVQVFVTKIDIRRAALCGGASHATDECTANPSSSIVTVAGDDPKFKTIFNEMMYKPQKELQKYKYPYEQNTGGVGIPVPPQ